MKQKITITYVDESANQKYDTISNIECGNTVEVEDAIAFWEDHHPGCHVTHAFNTSQDLMSSQSWLSKEAFAKYCDRYGLKPEDFGTTLDNGSVITGIRPRNRRYPIILFDPSIGRNRKATPNFVLSKMPT